MKKLSEIDIHRDNLSVYVLSRQGHDLESITPDNIHISRNNKIKKTPNTSFVRYKYIGNTINPMKMAK